MKTSAGVYVALWKPRTREFDLPKGIYELKLTYPLSEPYVAEIEAPSGLTTVGVINQIVQAYHEIYRDPQRYGVWGHEIGDLVIEAIEVRGNKISAWVGS
jgi:hypothetical protein